MSYITKINYLVVLFVVVLLHSNPGFAEPIGKLTLLEGLEYEVEQFGSDQEFKDYYIRANHKYIALADVKSIARINAGTAAIGYLVVLKNGEIHNGRIGFLFYEKVTYKSSENGPMKMAYVPVMKDRGQDGLLFINKDVLNQRNKNIEISNPNNIETLTFYDTHQQANNVALYKARQ